MSDNNINIRVGVTQDKSAHRTFNELDKKQRLAKQQTEKSHRTVGRHTRALGASSRAMGHKARIIGTSAAALGKYSRNIVQAVKQNKLLTKSLSGTGKMLDGVANKWTAVGGALGVGVTAKTIVDLSARYERLGIQANKSTEEMTVLREEIFKTAQAATIRTDDAEILSAIEKIVEKTGDLDLARRNIKGIAMTLSATGATGADIGAMLADMSDKFGINNASEMLQQLDTLVVQGKAGAFTLQAIANKGSRVSAAYASMGRTGSKAIQEMGALLQVSMMGTGEADIAATAFEATLRDLVSNREKLNDLGINLFDSEELAEGKEVARSIPEVLKEIVQATNGNVSEFSEVFGDESRRLVNVLATEYKNSGNFASLDKFMSMQGDGSTIMGDSARAAQTAAAAMNNLAGAWRRMADGALAEPIQKLADAMNSFDPETVQTILKVLTGGALLLGGAAIGKKVIGGVRGVAGIFSRGKGKGRVSGALSAMSGSGAAPVFVTNMPAGGFGGGEFGKKSNTRSGRGRFGGLGN